MRLSPSYYPEQIDFTCRDCWTDVIDADVDSIEDDDVVVTCPCCGNVQYEQVIFD